MQMKKGIGSWAIRWYWTIFMNGGLNLFPSRALVRNIGFDGSGTHNDIFVSDKNYDELCENLVEYYFPTIIKEDETIRKLVVENRKKRVVSVLKEAKAKALDEVLLELKEAK